MIPINILSKMGIYELKLIEGVEVKVSVVDNAALIDDKISELRSLLKKPVVGFDVKFHTDQSQRETAKLLILWVENCGLIIQLDQLVSSFPDCLKQFLDDESICFVGEEVEKKVPRIYKYCISCMSRVELGDFAARVLKNPSLCKCGTEDLLRELGENTVIVPGLPETTPDWSAKIFRDEEIKSAIIEAKCCYTIGYHLLRKLKL